MSLRALSVACAVGIVVAGSIALGSSLDRGSDACPAGSQPAASRTVEAPRGGGHVALDGHGHGHGHGHVVLGPTCNLVEVVGPQSSTYRPDLESATRTDRARARKLLRGANAFCRSQSASELTGGWVPGDGNPSRPTHFFNPEGRGALGLDPSNPRAALVYRGDIGGVMFTGTPLPHLGSVPRAHTHDPSGPREMLHVYCTPDLADAFTPSRRLGVLADAIALRQRVRSRVAHLGDPQLTDILGRVREYGGDALAAVDPRTIEPAETGDPVLRAKREEIRQALPLLTEAQLRAVLSMTSGP